MGLQGREFSEIQNELYRGCCELNGLPHEVNRPRPGLGGWTLRPKGLPQIPQLTLLAPSTKQFLEFLNRSALIKAILLNSPIPFLRIFIFTDISQFGFFFHKMNLKKLQRTNIPTLQYHFLNSKVIF